MQYHLYDITFIVLHNICKNIIINTLESNKVEEKRAEAQNTIYIFTKHYLHLQNAKQFFNQMKKIFLYICLTIKLNHKKQVQKETTRHNLYKTIHEKLKILKPIYYKTLTV